MSGASNETVRKYAAAIKRNPTPARLYTHSQEWRAQVKMKLIDGFGAEDIALHLGCHLSHVQSEVSRLRTAGEFAKWWGRE
jgi:DNA-directed RNA polymerase specialized sigma24 family protein